MIGTFTNASAGSDAQSASSAPGPDDQSASAREVIRNILGVPIIQNKNMTNNIPVGDKQVIGQGLEEKQRVVSLIYDGLLAQLNKQMKKYGVGEELRYKIQGGLTEFCHTIENNQMSGELPKIDLAVLNGIVISIHNENDKEVIKRLFKVVFAVLRMPDLVDRDVGIPTNLNRNLSYPDYLQYDRFIHECNNILTLPETQKLDKAIQEINGESSRDFPSSRYFPQYMRIDRRDKIIYTLVHTLLPQLNQSLTPEQRRDSCLLEMFQFLNPLTVEGTEPARALERYERLQEMVAFLYIKHDKGLYGITLRALEGMKQKGIIPADSVDKMIEQLNSLVNK